MAKYPPRRRGRPPIRRLALVGLALFGIWLAGLIAFAGTIPKMVADEETRTDAIVVLTGGSGRLDEGLRLLSTGLADKLFVSGVYQGLDVKALLALSQSNPFGLERRIGIGGATNTEGNADETADWVAAEAVTSLRLVTSGYHMPRSLLEFRHAMASVEVIAHPVFAEHVKVGRWWAWPGTTGLIAGEYNKFLLAWVRHMGENLFMKPNQQ